MSERMLSTNAIRAHGKCLAAFALSVGFAIAVVPALAQQQAPNVPALPYDYGYSHMWGGPWGWHPFMIIGPIFMLLAVTGIMAIFVWLVRWATHGYPFRDGGRGHAALDILDERFAKGEIDKAEFEEKRKLLGRR